MPNRVSCPYCNAQFLLSEAPAEGRAVCQRCGDAFPIRGRMEEGDSGEPQASERETPTPPPQPAAVGRRVLVPVALLLIVVGIGYVLYQPRRRVPVVPEPELPTAFAPVQSERLRGLGFLPPGCNVVFAAQPSPLLEYTARNQQNPRNLLVQVGLPPLLFDTLDHLGLHLEDIDHAAGGGYIPDAAESNLRVAIVLVLRRPLGNERQFLDHLKAKRHANGDRSWYVVEFPGNPLPLRLTKAADTVWVFSWPNQELDPAARAGTTPLPDGLRAILKEQLSAAPMVWAVATDANWAEKPLVPFVLGLSGKAEWVSHIKAMRAAAAGLTLNASPRLRVFVRGTDAGAGERLRAYFAARSGRGPDTQIEAAGDWARMSEPVEPAKVGAILKGLLDGEEK